jgi:SAM-dependent methyltransferase
MGLGQIFFGWRSNRRLGQRRPPIAELRGSFYLATTELPELLGFFAAKEPPALDSAGAGETIDGKCYACARQVAFRIDRDAESGEVNWRESLSCPGCGLINRWRSSLHMFELLFRPRAGDLIYITEAISPLYAKLAERYPRMVGSEYYANSGRSTRIALERAMARNEDLTALTFDEHSFAYLLTFDVLEHVPDFRLALRECNRVLAPGGQLMLSVPFNFRMDTETRAEIDEDGRLRHLAEPIYHGDPLQEQGVLCYYIFGMDLLLEMRKAGFKESFAVCFTSLEWAYYDDNVVFVGRKE